MYVYVHLIAIGEKRGHKFGREQGRPYEELGGRKGKGGMIAIY